MSPQRPNIVILCTGNSCRSQMAEAYARQYIGDIADVYSAGLEKHGLNPWMLRVMDEAGFDMSTHSSKLVEELPKIDWDLIITVCGHARENCPYLPAKSKLHQPFGDPPAMSKELTEEAAILDIYRQVRDEIAQQIPIILASYKATHHSSCGDKH